MERQSTVADISPILIAQGGVVQTVPTHEYALVSNGDKLVWGDDRLSSPFRQIALFPSEPVTNMLIDDGQYPGQRIALVHGGGNFEANFARLQQDLANHFFSGPAVEVRRDSSVILTWTGTAWLVTNFARRDEGVIDGLVARAPTTPSSQVSGAGNTTWHVDITEGDVVVNDVEETIAQQVDLTLHSGSQLLTTGQAVYAWLIVKELASVVAVDFDVGVPAASGSEAPPTPSQVDSSVGTIEWIRLALLRLERTGDTTLIQTRDNRFRERQ